MSLIVEAVYSFDDDEAESLLELLCGNLRTEEEMARKLILDAIDPVIALGDEFTFEEREPGDFYISLEVPDIGAQVDLIIAWQVAQLDAKACALTLEHDHSLEATLRVFSNSLAWLRFWSRRCPSDMGRKKFERSCEELGGRLAGLRDKAVRTANYAMMEELANV